MRKLTAVFLAGSSVALIHCGVQVHDYSNTDAGGCSTAPTLTCNPVSSGELGCIASAGAIGKESQLPSDTAYPVGCQAYFRGVDCSSRGYCTCDSNDAGAPRWNCHDDDGG